MQAQGQLEQLEHLTGRLRFFGVWGINPLGECECARGTAVQEVRDARVAWTGTCDSPGKHPWPGFPHGLHDAVDWEEWQQAEQKVRDGGGRAAAVLPDSLWVLDVDSLAGWRNLLALAVAGALPVERILATARTRRGWHIWYAPMVEEGWTGGAAQSDVNRSLTTLGRTPSGLDAKSAGGYVIWPEGSGERHRRWVDLSVFLHEATFAIGARPRVATRLEPLGATRPVREYAGGTSAADRALKEMMAYASEDQVWRWQEQELAAMRLRMTDVPQGTRNVALNRVAYIEGRRCIEAGVAPEQVRRELEDWGKRLGLGSTEVRATVRSGLGLG